MNPADPQPFDPTTPDDAPAAAAPQVAAPQAAVPASEGLETARADATSVASAPEVSTVDGAPEVVVTDVVDPRTVRRAPRFRAFAWAGILVGLVVSAALNLFALEAGHPVWSRAILTLEVTLGALVVAVVWALIADRRSHRRPGRR